MVSTGHSGVVIYKSVFDFIVTIVQPGDDDFMGRNAFAMSNIVSVRFAHAKNCSHLFPSPRDLLKTIFAELILISYFLDKDFLR